MAKLAIGTVTYRFYFRVENDNADSASLREVLSKDFEQAVRNEIAFPISKVIWEWHGDKIDPEFLNSIAYGQNPNELIVSQVAEEHRSYGFDPSRDNPTPINFK